MNLHLNPKRCDTPELDWSGGEDEDGGLRSTSRLYKICFFLHKYNSQQNLQAAQLLCFFISITVSKVQLDVYLDEVPCLSSGWQIAVLYFSD